MKLTTKEQKIKTEKLMNFFIWVIFFFFFFCRDSINFHSKILALTYAAKRKLPFLDAALIPIYVWLETCNQKKKIQYFKEFFEKCSMN